MEAAPFSSSVAAAENRGDLTPFLEKIYDIVNNPNTDEIISWSSNNNSFIVLNPTEFARVILPTYFMHNNFSNFTHQLNTYGFQKIDAEHWEYANANFIKDQKHLLKNIQCNDNHNHLRDCVDPERTVYDELIEQINNHQTRINLHLEHFQQRLDAIETTQNNLLDLFEEAFENPSFVDQVYDKYASG